MTFNCLKCGECCKNLHKSDFYKNLHNGNGICIYLKNNECTIYKNRPLLCRIEESYIFFKEKLTKEEYYELNYHECYKFIKNNMEEKCI